jgi:hypothetical protein
MKKSLWTARPLTPVCSVPDLYRPEWCIPPGQQQPIFQRNAGVKMAKDGKHVIHAGGIFANPQLNREGAAAADTPPGTIGFFDNTTKKFTASVDGNEAAILYVANYDYLRCKTVDDVIKAGDWVVAFHPTPGVFFNVPLQQALTQKGSLFCGQRSR